MLLMRDAGIALSVAGKRFFFFLNEKLQSSKSKQDNKACGVSTYSE